MKIEIIKVEHKEFDEVTTNHKSFNLYRRIGPEQWEHHLGNQGWQDYRFCDVIEQSYQAWDLKERNAKAETTDKRMQAKNPGHREANS